MRSYEADAGEPWPHDMTITVSGDLPLEELLYVRSALALGENGVPAVFPVPDAGDSRRPQGFDPADADLRWRQAWAAAWERLEPAGRRVRPPSGEMQHLLDTTPDDELWDAVSGLRPWHEAIDLEEMARWRMALDHDDHELPLDLTPERLALPALIAAWRSGLTTVVTLPLAGYLAVRAHPSHLVVSHATRDDATLYRRALATPLDRPAPPG